MEDQTRTRNVIPALSGLYQALSPWMEPLLRFIAGAMLVPHGCQKLFGMFGGGGLSGTAQFMDRVGYHPGMLWAYVVGLNEVIAGVLLAIGLLTRPAAAAVAIQMLFVMPVTIKRGWFGDNELAVLWLSVAIFFLIRGGGRCSVDRTIGREF
jgi:putative oxidoreductase